MLKCGSAGTHDLFGDSVAYPTGRTIDYNLSVSADTHSNTPQPLSALVH